MSYKLSASRRGFTLLIAVILSSVALALGLALLDVAYKQVTLALSSKQSQYAFANADTALECALFWDQRQDAFSYSSPMSASSISCGGMPIVGYATSQAGGMRTTTFYLTCPTPGVLASVTIQKASDAATIIFSNGYNVCDTTDPRRIERGMRVTY